MPPAMPELRWAGVGTLQEVVMATSQHQKALQFRALHDAPGVFLIPNPWDAGSARILSALGFQALATSSYASAGVHGHLDGELTREDALIDISSIVQATHLPVSADLGRGFGDEPPSVAKTIRLAADVGVVGASVEDATGDTRAGARSSKRFR